jgi:large subunit ribosomal protein LX
LDAGFLGVHPSLLICKDIFCTIYCSWAWLGVIFWGNIGEYVYNWDCIAIVQDEKNMKVFKVTGQINKPRLSTPFVRELLADKSEHAVEKVYAEIGSRHRVKRMHIKITSAVEVSGDAIENPILKKLVAGE